MPFGKHKGQPMERVPASYFHFLWTEGLKNESTPVANYIRDNMNALKSEHPDGIWE